MYNLLPTLSTQDSFCKISVHPENLLLLVFKSEKMLEKDNNCPPLGTGINA